MKTQSVTLLGSTGSVGTNTLNVIRSLGKPLGVAGLASRGSDIQLLARQVREFSPKAVFVSDSKAALDLRPLMPKPVKIFTQADGLEPFVSFLNADIVVGATSGTDSLEAVIAALKAGKRVALANKEILVAAGSLVMKTLKANPKASLLPIDSEHSAIFQCLEANETSEVQKLILTGSGGPLRQVASENFARLTKETVINHPKWKMGKKISVDSATLMNKGLEIIEASALFGIPVDQIEVLIHPEAVIHSMVSFVDGSVMAQMGKTDMRLPIQYALTYPRRLPAERSLHLDFASVPSLTFEAPNRKKFPCLDIAYEVARQSGSAPCVLSATDEVAVQAYLNDKISFTEIPGIIEKVLRRHSHVANPSLRQIQSLQDWASEETRRLCQAR